MPNLSERRLMLEVGLVFCPTSKMQPTLARERHLGSNNVFSAALEILFFPAAHDFRGSSYHSVHFITHQSFAFY